MKEREKEKERLEKERLEKEREKYYYKPDYKPEIKKDPIITNNYRQEDININRYKTPEDLNNRYKVPDDSKYKVPEDLNNRYKGPVISSNNPRDNREIIKKDYNLLLNPNNYVRPNNVQIPSNYYNYNSGSGSNKPIDQYYKEPSRQVLSKVVR